MAQETLFRLLVGFIFIAGISVSFHYRRRANQAGGTIPRSRDGRHIIPLQLLFLLCVPGSVLAYLIEPTWLAWTRVDLPLVLRWLGAFGAALAVPGMGWMFHHLGNNVNPTASVRDEAYLVTTGPYHYIRHPLYTIGILLWLSLSLVIGSWLIAFFTVLAFVVIAGRTTREEATLLERFGDEYQRYMERTPRYFPSLL